MSKSYGNGTNTLGLVIFGIVMGITLAKMGEVGKPLLDFFNALSEAMMIITNWVIWYVDYRTRTLRHCHSPTFSINVTLFRIQGSPLSV